MADITPTHEPETDIHSPMASTEGPQGESNIAVVSHDAPLAGEHGYQEMLSSPQTWVTLAFVLLFVFFGKKLFVAFARIMDSRSGRIANELAEAEKLKSEAEAVLASYKQKHAESMKEADDIIAAARKDAEQLVSRAEGKINEMLAARAQMAEEKISQAEKQAVDDIRNHVVDITIAAAKTMIEENIKSTSGDELVKRAIADIERKVH